MEAKFQQFTHLSGDDQNDKSRLRWGIWFLHIYNMCENTYVCVCVCVCDNQSL